MVDQELRAYLDQRFGAMERRFDVVDQRLDGIDRRLDGVDQRLDGVDQRLNGIDQRLEGLQHQINGIDERLIATENKVDSLVVDVDEVKHNLRAVAEGHAVIYHSVDERDQHYHEEIIGVRNMLHGWNQLLSSRVDALERDVKVLRERVGV